MEHINVYNTFKFQDRLNLNEVRKQAAILERIEKLKQLADAYNLNEQPLTIRFFGDLKSGLGFAIECIDSGLQQNLTKTLKMYLGKYQD